MHVIAFCLALTGTLLTLGGCGAGDHERPGPEPGGTYTPLTGSFVILGDTQEHESTGYPLHDNDSAVDAYVEVTQRPPEQALFGRRILEWALHSLRPGEPFLHLGDVLDLSCRVEAERIAHVFRHQGNAGAILPGNHDGLFFGIYAINLLDDTPDTDAGKWNHACRRGAAPDDRAHKSDREALSKHDFIHDYITRHSEAAPPKPGLEPPPRLGDHSLSWRNPDSGAFLSGIEARLIDGDDHADSFIAQRLQLPRAPAATRDVIIIGLDTNQAGMLVGDWDVLIGLSPGSIGHIHRDQISAIQPWVEEGMANDTLIVFAGHHDWMSLALPTRVMLERMMSQLDHPLVYLSAHTHRGSWTVHRGLSNRPLLEFNVSSLSDWPLAYRRLTFAHDEVANRLLVRAELLPDAAQPVASFGDLFTAWSEQTCRLAGMAVDNLHGEDENEVRRQRDSRGTLMEWLVSSMSPICESCDTLIYDHAQRYQDALLETLLETQSDLGSAAHWIDELDLPPFCGDLEFAACAARLQAERPAGHAAHVDLFRRKATLVSLLNDHLDELDSERARAYMTCRAVEAAWIDFALTPDDKTDGRGEARRIAEEMFRVEASVGMR